MKSLNSPVRGALRPGAVVEFLAAVGVVAVAAVTLWVMKTGPALVNMDLSTESRGGQWVPKSNLYELAGFALVMYVLISLAQWWLRRYPGSESPAARLRAQHARSFLHWMKLGVTAMAASWEWSSVHVVTQPQDAGLAIALVTFTTLCLVALPMWIYIVRTVRTLRWR